MSVNVAARQVRAGAWTTEVCDCCEEPMSWCEALCLPCAPVAAQHNRLTRNIIGVDPLCCLTMCLIDSCCTCGCTTLCTALKYRGEIRRRFGIHGDDCSDCCLTFLCPSCTISQQYRELCYRNAYPGGLCVGPPINTGMLVGGGGSPQMVVPQMVVYPATGAYVPQQQGQYPPQQQPQYCGNGPAPGIVMQQNYGYPQQGPPPPPPPLAPYSNQPQQGYGYPGQPQPQPYGYPQQQQTYPSQGY